MNQSFPKRCKITTGYGYNEERLCLGFFEDTQIYTGCVVHKVIALLQDQQGNLSKKPIDEIQMLEVDLKTS